MSSDKKLHVLLVDDCRLTVEQIAELIKSGPFDVSLVTASSEDAAIAAANNNGAELVVLDLNLKAGSGFGVLRALKAMESAPAVVVLTNFALPRYRELARLLGADYFLDKATGVEILPTIVQSVAKQHNLSPEFVGFEEEAEDFEKPRSTDSRPRLH